MCNLYASITAKEAMVRLFAIKPDRDRLGNAEPRPAIFPKGVAPVVRLADDGARELIEMRWGFLTPQMSKKTGKPIKPAAWNNTRDDKIASAPLWRSSFLHRRCLVPASSFHETQGRAPATDFWFALVGAAQDDRPPFAFAGLWREEHEDLREEGESGLTHTIVTTEANDLVRPIHAKGRMPVILDPADYERWLTGSPDEAAALLHPFPANRMRIVRHGVGEKTDPGECL